MNSETVETPAEHLLWSDITVEQREALSGKLKGLWGAETDDAAFAALSIDKQQSLFLILERLEDKELWRFVQRVTNLYGEGGVGIEFSAAPGLKATLSNRDDFTTRWARHRDTSGGFYEKTRSEAVLHFLYVNAEPAEWYLHFDLYSPVHSAASVFRHLRHEFIHKTTPDWRMIKKVFDREARR